MESDLVLEVIRVYIGLEKIYKIIFKLWEFDTHKHSQQNKT